MVCPAVILAADAAGRVSELSTFFEFSDDLMLVIWALAQAPEDFSARWLRGLQKTPVTPLVDFEQILVRIRHDIDERIDKGVGPTSAEHRVFRIVCDWHDSDVRRFKLVARTLAASSLDWAIASCIASFLFVGCGCSACRAREGLSM
eukprot:TRINITY_DN23588_c0_g1_i1.p2 TRINITY_DN23588_c0_g1~~TRINITY_DN23588_c0_g1_i1.p2  ORF type:complete len:147 (-),score=20.80 TRINITY_DN23588_c0_g1_i1:700-1140(-)